MWHVYVQKVFILFIFLLLSCAVGAKLVKPAAATIANAIDDKTRSQHGDVNFKIFFFQHTLSLLPFYACIFKLLPAACPSVTADWLVIRVP